MDTSLALAIALGYLLGSIPFAHLIATHVKGIDLSRVGSRNVGTRNLSRSVGTGWGALGGALDFGKGLLAMGLGHALAEAHRLDIATAGSDFAAPIFPLWILAGTAAVAGHNWPIWLRGRGGKGLATAMGAVAYVAWWPELLIVAAIGWLVLRLTQNVILMAATGFAAMLLSLSWFGKPVQLVYFVLSLALVVLLAALPDILSKVRTPQGVRKYFKDPNADYEKK